MNELNTDIDIKIAGDKPSEDIKKRNEKKEETAEAPKTPAEDALPDRQPQTQPSDKVQTAAPAEPLSAANVRSASEAASV